MDGEMVMGSQKFDDMSEADMLAELEKLEDRIYEQIVFSFWNLIIEQCCINTLRYSFWLAF